MSADNFTHDDFGSTRVVGRHGLGQCRAGFKQCTGEDDFGGAAAFGRTPQASISDADRVGAPHLRERLKVFPPPWLRSRDTQGKQPVVNFLGIAWHRVRFFAHLSDCIRRKPSKLSRFDGQAAPHLDRSGPTLFERCIVEKGVWAAI